jgi:hypothetical protein
MAGSLANWVIGKLLLWQAGHLGEVCAYGLRLSAVAQRCMLCVKRCLLSVQRYSAVSVDLVAKPRAEAKLQPGISRSSFCEFWLPKHQQDEVGLVWLLYSRAAFSGANSIA